MTLRHFFANLLLCVLAVACQEIERPADSADVKSPGRPVPEASVLTDPQVIRDIELATVRGGPALGMRSERLEARALLYNPMPTVVTVAPNGRTFFSFPRWTDPVPFTVGELKAHRLVAYPDPQINSFDPDQPQRLDPRDHLVSVQSVVADERNRLWILDTGSINLRPVISNGPKLLAYDLNTNQRVKDIRFSSSTVKPRTYLNDVRFDLSRGQEGYAFITDSGEGAIIVVDLATGQSWRKLEDHFSVKPVPGFVPLVEGQQMMKDPAGGPGQPINIAADGIALSPDRNTLYYTPLSSRSIYAVSVDALVDRNRPDDQVAQTVRQIAQKPSANDGIVCDPAGRIYTTDFEDNAIRRVDPNTGRVEVVFQDERLLWPDSVWVQGGDLYVTANQLNRQSTYNDGQDRRQPPFVLFRYPLEGPAGLTQYDQDVQPGSP